MNSTDLTVELDDYKNFQVQLRDIFQRRELTSLTIRLPDAYRGKWVTFSGPPEQASDALYEVEHEVGHLPDALGNLKRLDVLSISFLGLHTLPPSFVKLSRLRELNISFNRLTLSQELPKLLSLNRLRLLKIYGCEFTGADLAQLQRMNPNLKVQYTLQHYLDDMDAGSSEV